MPDETNGLPLPPAPEGDEGEDIHVLAQVLLHFHADTMERAHEFTQEILKEIEEFAQKRVEETEGVWIPEPFGLKPGEGELSDEDIAKLLNPEGTD